MSDSSNKENEKFDEAKTIIKDGIRRIGNALGDINSLMSLLDTKEPELKPKDWQGEPHGFLLSYNGNIADSNHLTGDGLFYAKEAIELEPLARRQKITSVIHRLKQSLNDNHEFEYGKVNFNLFFDGSNNSWDYQNNNNFDYGGIYFSTEDNAKQVRDYLNEHYPNGWK